MCETLSVFDWVQLYVSLYPSPSSFFLLQLGSMPPRSSRVFLPFSFSLSSPCGFKAPSGGLYDCSMFCLSLSLNFPFDVLKCNCNFNEIYGSSLCFIFYDIPDYIVSKWRKSPSWSGYYGSSILYNFVGCLLHMRVRVSKSIF